MILVSAAVGILSIGPIKLRNQSLVEEISYCTSLKDFMVFLRCYLGRRGNVYAYVAKARILR